MWWTRFSVGLVVVSVALVSCGGDDDGVVGPPEPMFCSNPGGDSMMYAGTAEDPCPQDKCPDDPMVMGTNNDYVTLATCSAAVPPATMGTWGQCRCMPRCGNGVRQVAEACEGNDLGGMNCQALGKQGIMMCNNRCQIVDMCTTPAVPTGGNTGG